MVEACSRDFDAGGIEVQNLRTCACSAVLPEPSGSSKRCSATRSRKEDSDDETDDTEDEALRPVEHAPRAPLEAAPLVGSLQGWEQLCRRPLEPPRSWRAAFPLVLPESNAASNIAAPKRVL